MALFNNKYGLDENGNPVEPTMEPDTTSASSPEKPSVAAPTSAAPQGSPTMMDLWNDYMKNYGPDSQKSKDAQGAYDKKKRNEALVGALGIGGLGASFSYAYGKDDKALERRQTELDRRQKEIEDQTLGQYKREQEGAMSNLKTRGEFGKIDQENEEWLYKKGKLEEEKSDRDKQNSPEYAASYTDAVLQGFKEPGQRAWIQKNLRGKSFKEQKALLEASGLTKRAEEAQKQADAIALKYAEKAAEARYREDPLTKLRIENTNKRIIGAENADKTVSTLEQFKQKFDGPVKPTAKEVDAFLESMSKEAGVEPIKRGGMRIGGFGVGGNSDEDSLKLIDGMINSIKMKNQNDSATDNDVPSAEVAAAELRKRRGQ